MAERPPALETVTLRSLARRAAVPLIVVLVVAGIASALLSQTARLDDFAWRFTPGWLVLAAVAFLAYQAMLCGVWMLLMRDLGCSRPLRRQAAIWNVSLLARYTPTSALMTVVRVGMYEREGVARRTTLVASVYELLLQLIVAVVVGAWWMLHMDQLEDHWSRYLLLAVPLLGFVSLHPRILGKGVAILLRRFGREGEPVTLPTRQVLVAALLYAVCFLTAGVGVLGVALALHPVDAGDVPLVIASFAIGFVVSVLAFMLPGGLGARETGLATALTPALPFAVGLAVAVATRAAQMAIEVLYAAVSQMLGGRVRTDAERPEAGPEPQPAPPTQTAEPVR